MAQEYIYKPMGAMEVLANTSFSTANLPDNAHIVRLQMGTRLTDKKGGLTPIRGVRMTISTTGVTPASSPVPNIPFIWYENTIYKIDPAFTYLLHDDAIIGYGREVNV